MSQIYTIFVTVFIIQMESSIQNKIAEKISSFPKGTIILPSDLIDIGSFEAIRQSLSRLHKSGLIIRISQGIYLYPKKDKLLGVLNPSIEDIAETIAKRDKARIIPTGVLALNKLGLSTQVPMKIVYLTDGAPRIIKIGKQSINFKKTSPKNLAVKSEIIMLIIQALKELGQKNTTKETIQKINFYLQKEKSQNMLDDIKLAPAWIVKILLPLITKKHDRVAKTTKNKKGRNIKSGC